LVTTSLTLFSSAYRCHANIGEGGKRSRGEDDEVLDNSAANNSFQNTNTTCNNNPLTPPAAGGRVGKNPFFFYPAQWGCFGYFLVVWFFGFLLFL
jgi:hypothetical protein